MGPICLILAGTVRGPSRGRQQPESYILYRTTYAQLGSVRGSDRHPARSSSRALRIVLVYAHYGSCVPEDGVSCGETHVCSVFLVVSSTLELSDLRDRISLCAHTRRAQSRSAKGKISTHDPTAVPYRL